MTATVTADLIASDHEDAGDSAEPAATPDRSAPRRRSPRDRDGGQDPVEHAVGGHALQLGLGA